MNKDEAAFTPAEIRVPGRGIRDLDPSRHPPRSKTGDEEERPHDRPDEQEANCRERVPKGFVQRVAAEDQEEEDRRAERRIDGTVEEPLEDRVAPIRAATGHEETVDRDRYQAREDREDEETDRDSIQVHGRKKDSDHAPSKARGGRSGHKKIPPLHES